MDFKVTRATTRQVGQVASSPTFKTSVVRNVLQEVETSNLSCSVRVGPKAPVFGFRFVLHRETRFAIFEHTTLL